MVLTSRSSMGTPRWWRSPNESAQRSSRGWFCVTRDHPRARTPHAIRSRDTIVTVGTFDGVHRGHQDVLLELAKRAGETTLEALLVTFDPHPLEIVRPEVAPLLLTPGFERLEALV